uniref:Uncharacterized protein n=1 Tax=Gasterosteus aculeatus aculeatus TaxID=481459 RepID=A0AAQ4PW11_GASAC
MFSCKHMLTICASCNVITFLLLLIGIDTDLANRIYVCSRASLQIVSPPGSSCIVLLPRAVNRVVCQPCIHFQAPRAFLNSISDLQVPPVTCREKLYPTSMSQTTRGLQIPSAQPARMMCFDMFVPPFQRSWETRSLRKHRRRVEDEGCTAKRRRLMFEVEVGLSENSSSSSSSSGGGARRDWPAGNGSPPAPAVPQPHPASQNLTLQQSSSAPPRPEVESSCMEVEAAQRKLQEIEDRITLEDDDEDEDLDLEPAPRRPVLVMSDSLKEGLQRGIGDILPHTVAQSVSHSCMELVLWRPPDDPFCRRRKFTVQRQRKQQIASQQPPTPCSSPTPPSAHSSSSAPADAHSSLYVFPVAHCSGEEDMEM